MRRWFADFALVQGTWQRDVCIDVENGVIARVCSDAPRDDADYLGRYVLPGMPNLHSHAFQRALAGRTERFERPDDSFWTWREAMYREAAMVDPDRLFVIARLLYADLLEMGYTRVCEFHYVHHQANGNHYAPVGAMSDALIAAAQEAGIGLTLLPTLYQRGGFRDEPLAPRQQRFAFALDDYLHLLDTLAARDEGFRFGAAIHSLRAVDAETIAAVCASPVLRGRPIHIHISEQRRELEECLVVHGRYPIDRLIDIAPVDRRFCLVHATHASHDELAAIVRCGAVVGLCPTTEANLGDGLFEIGDYCRLGGRFGIGSDSHVGLDPREELRWLEYQARLASGQRNELGSAAKPDVAANLWSDAVLGGAQACGASAGGIAVGADADFIELDPDDPAFAPVADQEVLAAWLFASARRPIKTVTVSGKRVIQEGRHSQRDVFESAFRDAVRSV